MQVLQKITHAQLQIQSLLIMKLHQMVVLSTVKLLNQTAILLPFQIAHSQQIKQAKMVELFMQWQEIDSHYNAAHLHKIQDKKEKEALFG